MIQMSIEDTEDLFGFPIFQLRHRADPRKDARPGPAAGFFRLFGKPERFFFQ